MVSIVLHVGLPKTASTFLQNCFFPFIEGYSFLTSDKCKWPTEMGWLFEINTLFDKVDYKIKNKFSNELLSNIDTDFWIKKGRKFLDLQKYPLLLSSEGLCGVSYNPLLNNSQINKFLFQLFGKCKIILFFRNQADWCESIYKQLVFKENRFRRFLNFAELYGINNNNKKSLVNMTELDWGQLIKNYHNVFGRENVLPIPYEYFVFDMGFVIEKISNFLGTNAHIPEDAKKAKLNRSKQEVIYQHPALRTILSDIKHEILKDGRIDHSTVKGFVRALYPFKINYKFNGVDSCVKCIIKGKLAKQNNELASITGIDLKEFGYF